MTKTKVPPQYRRAIDELKDGVITTIFEQMEILRGEMLNFKKSCFEETETYMEVLDTQYNAPNEGKGNLTLINTDGTKKIEININDRIEFDEKLKVAKKLIDKCINKWAEEGSNPHLAIIVKDTFNVDKTGKVNIPRVLNLRRLDIKDEDWQKAMQAITDSLMVMGSKKYIRFHVRRDEYSDWKHITLNFASLDLSEMEG